MILPWNGNIRGMGEGYVHRAKEQNQIGVGPAACHCSGSDGLFRLFCCQGPAEFPDLDGYTGCVTITHGNALLDARMDEQDSARLIGFLAHARFSPSEEARTTELQRQHAGSSSRTAGRSLCSGRRKRSLSVRWAPMGKRDTTPYAPTCMTRCGCMCIACSRRGSPLKILRPGGRNTFILPV